MLDRSILPVILMDTRIADETVTFSDPKLELLHRRIAAFHMPSRFDPLAPCDRTELANDNFRHELAVPPRDAPESTNTYKDAFSAPAFCKGGYNEPAGKYAVYKSLARWA
eukprot:1715837-Pleurochrysis_carterae.AAC.1